MANKYLNDTGLQYFYNKLKTVFQAKESGKGLSTNDYTTAEKTKLSGIATGAEVNQNAFSHVVAIDNSGSSTLYYSGDASSKTDTLNFESGDNISLSIITEPPLNQATLVISAKTYPNMTQSQATAGTSTTSMLISPTVLSTTIASAIASAVAGISGISYEVVQSLPATGSAGVIYLVSHSHGTQDIYDEYIWTGSSYEKIGNTDVDLSGYMLKTDMVAITTTEIDSLFS